MDTAAATKEEYLTFELGGEEYGVPILRVKEIVEYARVTPVPTLPVFIRGVIDLRDRVVPVVDLGAKFGLGPSEITRLSCIVFVEVTLAGRAVLMGVLVDSVSRVAELKHDQIDTAPVFGTRIRVECLKGLGRIGKKLVLLLDIDHVMSIDEMLAAAQAAEEAKSESLGSADEPGATAVAAVPADPDQPPTTNPETPSDTTNAEITR